MAADPNYYDRPYTLVSGQIDQMTARLDTAFGEAIATMNQLQNIGFAPVGTGVPVAPDVAVPAVAVAPPAPIGVTALSIHPFTPPTLGTDADLLGDLGDETYSKPHAESPQSLAMDTVAQYQAPNLESPTDLTSGLELLPVPEFTATVAQRPDPAPLDLSGRPERPVDETISLPAAPSYTPPSLPGLLPLTVPSFSFDAMPVFEGQRPSFTGTPPSAALTWSRRDYTADLLDSVRAALTQRLLGGTGLPPDIETALFQRAREREDSTALGVKQAAFDDWAGRGWPMPPGMLVEAVAIVDEKNQLAVNDLSRDILTKAATWEIENLRDTLAKGISLETALMETFRDLEGLTLDAAKTQQGAELRLYDASITLFNAYQGAYQTDAAVFETRTRAKIETIKAEIEAQQLIGTLNEQQVRVYTAQWQGIQTQVEVYRTEMAGRQAQSQIIRDRIAAWGDSLKAWVEELGAQKVAKYETFQTLVQADSSFLDSRSRAYAASLSGVTADGNLKIEKVRARIAALDAVVKQFSEQSAAERGRVESETGLARSRAEALVEALRAVTQRYEADSQAETRRFESVTSWRRMQAEARVSAHNATTTRYQAEVQGESAFSEADARRAQAESGALEAQSRRFAAESDHNTKVSEQAIRAAEAQTRNNVALYEVAVREFQLLMEQVIQKSRIISEAIQSAGGMASQMAGGFAAAMHVSASMTGSADIGFSEHVSNDVNTNYNYDMPAV